MRKARKVAENIKFFIGLYCPNYKPDQSIIQKEKEVYIDIVKQCTNVSAESACDTAEEFIAELKKRGVM